MLKSVNNKKEVQWATILAEARDLLPKSIPENPEYVRGMLELMARLRANFARQWEGTPEESCKFSVELGLCKTERQAYGEMYGDKVEQAYGEMYGDKVEQAINRLARPKITNERKIIEHLTPNIDLVTVMKKPIVYQVWVRGILRWEAEEPPRCRQQHRETLAKRQQEIGKRFVENCNLNLIHEA